MSNDWFFIWHNINMPDRLVDVEDFHGGRIRVGGVVFQGQIQEIYWSSVSKHLLNHVHKGFRQWETECVAYPPLLKLSALNALERALNGYAARIMQMAVRTDCALRGRGDPSSAPAYNSTATHSAANAEVLRLKAAHLALLSNEQAIAKLSLVRRVEEHFTKWRGVYAGVGLLVGFLGLAVKFFF
ncbi:hypothetical protein ACSHT2_25570 [Bradyrhizobium sp. PUT101]|uniref:hypothetical protein n=1 Tax=Bradyrhizobium sp. PUT101 TaxID=3447427 RepID=UPI003F86AA36